MSWKVKDQVPVNTVARLGTPSGLNTQPLTASRTARPVAGSGDSTISTLLICPFTSSVTLATTTPLTLLASDVGGYWGVGATTASCRKPLSSNFKGIGLDVDRFGRSDQEDAAPR
jgi:hypothetical protein